VASHRQNLASAGWSHAHDPHPEAAARHCGWRTPARFVRFRRQRMPLRDVIRGHALTAARTQIATFSDQRVLVAEPFDRHWRNVGAHDPAAARFQVPLGARIARLQQEDFFGQPTSLRMRLGEFAGVHLEHSSRMERGDGSRTHTDGDLKVENAVWCDAKTCC
jgi:hypothetical protein